MTQLVQIAPGVVFSSDVLGVAWLRKSHGDHVNAGESSATASSVLRVGSAAESGVAIPDALPTQMSLL
ncbi:hypothetical protein WR30_30610 [Burkholderia contaminans FFH2055]|uniref:hypothetical protein n=1 Tax=Burkholderia contaminans TaxID=488447 RepID=UPI0006258AED|nr:hypothetical protein [Burkholderia contaminans]KKL31103.1 hypothetical protein WR30_30610 [Burkholderia contaminans FFH2055]MEB4631489.1 hypothetical protein [Burkholderia contaminans]MEB4637074.1 hypothetical protein [Burkholderia contaminans]MEB4652158.1 hypothetical protein [Burkholderia contaminans]MEB4665693.1 hypothetical protein [Burkholderia contaminans]